MSAARQTLHKIWITTDWYLQVDSRGQIAGPWFEGALGCVIQLLRDIEEVGGAGGSESRRYAKLALKLPRMMAGTLSENEYIRSILNDERKVVELVNRERALNSGLIALAEIQSNPLLGLRGLRQSPNPEVRAQDGCAIFLCMRKGERPRFCSIKLAENGEVASWPPGLARELGLSESHWQTLEADSMDRGQGFRCAVFFDRDALDPDSAVLTPVPMQTRRLLEILERGQTPREIWYAGLPSVPYVWSTGTLQETVSRGLHKEWGAKHHYELIKRVLCGVQTLHNEGCIHGDIRPANVMAVGHPAKPDSYALGDYGGLGDPIPDAPQESGHTVLGPSIHKFRQSVFYAPERRTGIERENADTLIILTADPLDQARRDVPDMLVHLGWRSELVDPNTSALREDKLQMLRETWVRLRGLPDSKGSSSGGMDRLRRNDRLRIRDYVFTITKSAPDSDQLSFVCSRRFAQVLHERMSIVVRDPIPDQSVISIPMYTEVRQTSAASDIYSVGVLALYMLFTSSLITEGGHPGSTLPSESILVTKDAEAKLASIISVMEEPFFLQIVWPELVEFCRHIDDFERSRAEDIQQLAELPIQAGEESKSFSLRIVDLTDKILHFCPNLYHILAAFKYNPVHFLLFIHFALSCIHRRSGLEFRPSQPLATVLTRPEGHPPERKPKAEAAPAGSVKPEGEPPQSQMVTTIRFFPSYEFPFCENRLEQPRANHDGAQFAARLSAATSALQRIERVQEICLQTKYDFFRKTDREFPPPRPLSDFEAKRRLAYMEREIQSVISSPIGTQFFGGSRRTDVARIRLHLQRLLPGR